MRSKQERRPVQSSLRQLLMNQKPCKDTDCSTFIPCGEEVKLGPLEGYEWRGTVSVRGRSEVLTGLLGPTALIFHLHGLGSCGHQHLSIFSWLKFSEYPALHLIPDAKGNKGWMVYDPRIYDTGKDDVGFLRKLLDAAFAKFKVDRKRVYLMGYSNGGGMSHRVACEKGFGEDIAAAVTFAPQTFRGSWLDTDHRCKLKEGISALTIWGWTWEGPSLTICVC